MYYNFHFSENDRSIPDKPVISEEHICAQSIYLQLKLQQADGIIKKLQKRCSVKTTEIARLKSSLKRLTLSKMNLKEILQETKDKKMISEKELQVLQVNVFALWKSSLNYDIFWSLPPLISILQLFFIILYYDILVIIKMNGFYPPIFVRIIHQHFNFSNCIILYQLHLNWIVTHTLGWSLL